VRKPFLIISLTGLAILSIASIVYSTLNAKKVAYVSTVQVFNEFKMKKVLESDFQRIESFRKEHLDSLELMIKVIQNDTKLKNKQAILEYKTEEFYAKQQEFERANSDLTAKYNDQIVSQLKQYVKDYGVENRYDFIYGDDGELDLMFASEKHDVTKQVIEYINKRYEGYEK
jgi:outer membrane protein